MFGFMKKSSVDKEREREEKEKKKKEKKEKKDKKRNSTTSEELARLEEAKKGLFWKSNGAKGMDSSVTASESSESLSSTPDTPSVYTATAKVEISKTVKVPPRTQPKPQKPRGILKGRSNYGPEIPNQGVRGNLDDTITVEENTYVNEVMSGKELEMQQRRDAEAHEAREARKKSVQSMIREIDQTSIDSGDGPDIGQGSLTQRTFKVSLGSIAAASDASPPLPATDPPLESEMTAQQLPQIEVALEPGEKSYENVDLQLPNVAPPRCPKPREIHLKRQPAGDYGFILRRGTVLQRDVDDTVEKKRVVIFAEPGPKNLSTGLLPGDRLIEVGGYNVEGASREEIIEHIRKSGASVSLRVQPIPELSELSLRSGLEGEDVEIQESSISTGTLKRSGSMRFRNKQAKSEEQLATEKAWLSAERVWLVHKGGFAAARLQRISDGEDKGEGESRVKLDFGGEIVDVEEDDVEKCNPPQYDRVEDLASLRYLNESSVLHTLRQRYGSNLIHSYGGSTLLIVNPMHPLSIYSENVIQMFRGCKQEDMPPHVYAIAQIAYRTMQSKRQDQSIVFLGRSGSGKTTNARHVLHYYTVAAASPSSQSILNADKLNALFTLLDAFGSSRTIMNTSATRYVQLTSLDFDQSGQIAGASVQVLLLEKSRVARRPEGEPTFHVFYQMLAGIDSTLRKDLQLEDLNEPNLFMTPLQRTEDRQRAQQVWGKIMHSMTSLLMSQSEISSLVAIMAAIYHLGVAGVTKGANQKNQFARPGAAQRAAHCLGCSSEELSRNVFSPSQTLQTKSSFRGTPDKSPSRPVETLSGIECLEGFVIGLYSEVFSALLSLINRSLSSNARTLSSILLLDPPGFQNPFSCGRQGGASFEDLCHNYLQERLQLLFHEKVFTTEQDLYAQENIDCDFELLTSSPAPMVQLFDKASSQALVRSPNQRDPREADERGLLWILDEEAILQGSSEETFVQRVIQNLGDQQETKESLLRRNGAHSFTINHFQGTNPVTYSVKGWLRLCRENPVSRGVNSFLQDSQREEVRSLFSSVRGSMGGAVSGSIVGMEGTSSLRRTVSMRRTFTTGTASLKRRSLCVQVKFQADSIIDTIRRSQAHFIHCVLPQNNAGLCDLKNALTPAGSSSDDIMMNIPLVRSQLRGSEVLEAIRIHRHGFPEHIQFAELRKRFDILLPPDQKPSNAIFDEKQAVQKLLDYLEVDVSSYRLGLSQIFFRAGAISRLEDAREERISGFIGRLQAHCRGYLGRRKLQKLKLQHLAVTCIQRNVRLLMGIRNWSWWRLYTKVQPLLNVHRTEEELRNTEQELDLIKQKYEKLEKERNDYKQASDRMESKLAEISADLADEHSTTNQASDLLEQETSERLRLEKEYKDMQAKFNTLKRKQEQTEMDLLHTRMLAASMDNDSFDEEEGDSVYKDRYERLRRENEMNKQQMKREHADDLEQAETARKHLNRKLAETIREADDQKRQATNVKRKTARLAQEIADSKRHIEEAMSRNAELEKKQRKCDSDIHKANEIAKEEKMLREKLQRERDQLTADKFSSEQEIKNLKMDKDLQHERLQRSEKEVLELSSVEKNDREAVSLKRMKNELEAKILDQEEELDEQAGTIQQLEQTKLRLEMQQEKVRQQHSKELDEKEQEVEELRTSIQKKGRMMESQVEEEYEEKQAILKEKRELERKLQDMGTMAPARDRDGERRLRKDLKRTKALLQDAQLVLQKQKDGAGSKNTIRQLRNQLEDVEFAAAAAIKARKGAEMEVHDLQQQLEDISKSKKESEERCMQLSRDNNDLQTQLEENDEDTAELMKKYKAAVAQQNVDLITFQDQSLQIEELKMENETLREEVLGLNSRVQFYKDSTVDVESQRRLEAKIKELESRLDFEASTRQKAETQLLRSKEQLSRLTEDKTTLTNDEQKQQEVLKRIQRQLRDAEEQRAEVERHEAEASSRKQELERKVSSLESEFEQSQSDLKLAFKRISDLQGIIQDDLQDEDSDEDDGASDYDHYTDSDDSDSEDDDRVNHRNHSYVRATGGSMSSSVERGGGRHSTSDTNDSSSVPCGGRTVETSKPEESNNNKKENSAKILRKIDSFRLNKVYSEGEFV